LEEKCHIAILIALQSCFWLFLVLNWETLLLALDVCFYYSSITLQSLM